MKTPDIPKPEGLPKPANATSFFCTQAMLLEKVRGGAQSRLAHLENQGRTDPQTEGFLAHCLPLEEYVDGQLGVTVLEHCTAPWWRYGKGCDHGVKGAGRELIGKVIGPIEAFGRWYPLNDPMIPHYVTRTPVPDDNGELWVWVEGIERLTTPSKLVKYAGFCPGDRRTKGGKIPFNSQLKTVMFRLVTSFSRQTNLYYDFGQDYKERKLAEYAAKGIHVRPTPKGRYCPECDEEKDVPSTTGFCPDCDGELSKKDEPAGVVWQGHLDMMARRRVAKLFLCHLWVVWREELGLPVRQPYPVEYRGHTQVISPWEMCDNKAREEAE